MLIRKIRKAVMIQDRKDQPLAVHELVKLSSRASLTPQSAMLCITSSCGWETGREIKEEGKRYHLVGCEFMKRP